MKGRGDSAPSASCGGAVKGLPRGRLCGLLASWLAARGRACGDPDQPVPPNRGKRRRIRISRSGKSADLMKTWTDERNAAYIASEDSDTRQQQVKNTVDFYGGDVLSQSSSLHTDTALADSFSLRIRLKGKGLRDLVLNYPFLFEVVEPDDISLPQTFREAIARDKENVTLVPPPATAPAVCVIDSGLQEEHYLLEPAVDQATSYCFLPGVSPTDVADYVKPGGHGTRVGGAILSEKPSLFQGGSPSGIGSRMPAC